MTPIAALTMYDLPELRAATDAWWATIARHLARAGIADVPQALTRGRPVADNWRNPALLLTQTCGYPLTHDHAGDLMAIAVPDYRAEGCGGGLYRSAFVVRADDPAASLADLRGRRVAANGPDSQSGCNALRIAVAMIAGSDRFFSEVHWSGAHRLSLAMVRDGQADIAAIDGVTFALVGDAAPQEVEGLRVLDWSAATPALPYAVRLELDRTTGARVTQGLMSAAADPDAAAARDALRLNGLLPARNSNYKVMVQMREAAEEHGYPVLA
ncbi:MAG: PhnD/SsuA/transferrin family substrate-binding protein [Thalassobaculaceae bacterium]|nr:PhnD/SsuA/transferrin family substrate-binding protein [Thalassobaculaceae bacterium]